MRKLSAILFCILSATICHGQVLRAVMVDTNRANLVMVAQQNFGAATNTASSFTFGGPIFFTNAVEAPRADMCLNNAATRAFTLSVFGIVTAAVQQVRFPFTSGGSNVTTGAAGDVAIYVSTSFASSANNLEIDAHIFTNGVDTLIGWSRTIGGGNIQGSAAGNGMLYGVPQGTVFDFRINPTKTTTLTFDHFHVMYKYE